VGRRYLEAPGDARSRLRAPLDAVRLFRARLLDLPHEEFSCLFLDTRHRLIRYEQLFRGTVDGATVYPREVVKRALHHNASAVIVGHNHPSGVSEPSEADRSITLKLAQALALVEIRLLDHLIVSRGGHVSLAERGWI
jgi:DNA repair protein RadC